jgi:hypothetical protein
MSNKRRYHLGNLGIDLRIILKWIIKKYMKGWNGLIWFRKGTSD